MSKYNILFSLEKNLYLDGAPVLLEAGALVSNTESGRVHIQLKFKNLSNTTISMVKVSFVLMDSIGREIGRSEKQYIDLKAKLNESFGDKDPAFLIDNTVRKFSAIIEEICFTDGNIWTVPENAVWEKIPTAQSIKQNLTTSEAIDEFKLVYCRQAQFIPFAHKDLWVCSCGNVNKNAHEKCCSCGANFADMESVDNETLKKNNIYRNATALVNKSVSSEIKKGIALFGCIPGWKDSTTKLEESKQKLILVSQHEKDKQIKNTKQNKKNIIIAALSFVSVVILIIGISIAGSITKANKYEQAQELMAQHKYSEAMSLLDDLEGYENADELYLRASYMYNGNYKEIVKMDNLTEFVIPEGTTKIADKAFYKCDKLTNITIPDSVTVIGAQAFYECSKLTNINIPSSVQTIQTNAFEGTNDLKNIYITDIAAWCNIDFRTTTEEVSGWGKFTFVFSNPFYLNARNLYLNGEVITDLVIPSTVNIIKAYTFTHCDWIKSVTIPENLQTIEKNAFDRCDNLSKVYFEGSINRWCEMSFENEFSNPLSNGADLYINNNLLVNIEVQGEKINSYVFSGCTSLKSAVISKTVTDIGYKPFSADVSLYLEHTTDPDSWQYSIKAYSSNNIYWNYGGKHGTTADGFMWYLTNDNKVTIISYTGTASNLTVPKSIGGYTVNIIHRDAFYSNKSLVNVTLPNTITIIGEEAFSDCDNLTSITIPDSVTSIGDSAFV